MTIADWMMIVVVFLSPVVAVRLTRYLDNQREIRERKVQIFKTLMATRAYTTSWPHVEALNRIDLEPDRLVERWRLLRSLSHESRIHAISLEDNPSSLNILLS